MTKANGGEYIMIEFDPIEHLKSPLSDDELRVVARFVDRTTYDKLLYQGDQYVGITGNHTSSVNGWPELVSNDNGYLSIEQIAREYEKAKEARTVKQQSRRDCVASWSEPCDYTRRKLSLWSADKKKIVSQALGGAISCRMCREIHKLEGFTDEQC